MAIDNFKPEMWSSELLVALRKTLVFAGPGVVNHDYEGEIQQAGDTVHISSVGDVAISDYTKGATLTYTDVDDAGTVLVVDQAKSFAKKLDDVDAAQSLNSGRVMAQIMQNAAYNLSDATDQYVASLYTQISSGNVLTAVTDFSASGTAYNTLVNLGVKLDEANVPSEGRYVIVPPWYYALLLKDPNFINAEKSGSTAPLRNGAVGQAAGFDVMKSNNCQQPSAGTTYVVQAGTPMALSFANQIVKTEALRLQTTFADAVRGLHVYGAKVIYPDGLACVTCTRA
jgi:N4-gp56 family major capsid protein